jgi:hypothetical protein
MSHPITPPPELIRQWLEEFFGPETMPGMAPGEVSLHIATQAARWGADEQRNADCEWVQSYAECGDSLLAAMRPKLPRLAEEALKALQDQIDTSFKISSEAQERANTIRAALERLKELEQNND